MRNKVTCRPCKEQPGKWEIENQNGNVLPAHYNSKNEACCAAKKYAEEFGCELVVESDNNSNQMNK